VVVNQYGAEGEIACCAALFRGLKRQYGHRKVLWGVIVAVIVLVLMVGF
jgi:predicted tellurium resistance membrane protein TerC